MSRVKLFHKAETVNIKRGNTLVPLIEYVKQTCPSLYGPEAVYHSTPYMKSGHLQTAYAAYYNGAATVKDVTYERELLDTPDGGSVALDWTNPVTQEQVPTLVVLHGLTGGSHESYIRSLLQVLICPPFQYRAVVLNSRGCANSEIKTPQMYNGAYTGDLRLALVHIQKKLGVEVPLVGIGFSLGSNILVKYLGEEQEKTPFKAAISVANPFDFMNSMNHLENSYLGKTFYSPAMATNLKKVFSKHMDLLEKGGKIDKEQIMSARTIRDFDDACTRRMFDYTTVNNYYRDASSCRFIEHVKVPLLCLNALDDPIAHANSIPYDEIKCNPNVILATTDEGGHIGWFEHITQPTRWCVKPLSEFIVAMFQAHDVRKTVIEGKEVEKAVENVQQEATGEQIA
ncbi:Alpha/Beta hydrolase protein [Sporodiniella umbellata]|nr:Alpha/Beta hydrolase protein [Sporodiniella umbellata]